MKIADVYAYSILATLSYVDWTDSDPWEDAKNQERVPVLPGEKIFKPGIESWQHWSIDNYQPEDPVGFSATLFQQGQGGEKVLAIRGTRPDGLVAGWQDLMRADLHQIGEYGMAISQAVSLFNYIQRLRAPAWDKQVLQLDLRLGVPGPHSVMISVGIGFSVDVRMDGQGLGLLGPADTLTVTGHSLGGHLAALAMRLFPGLFDRGVTFNAPGFDPLLGLGVLGPTLGKGLTDEFIDTLIAPFLPGPPASSFSSLGTLYSFVSEDSVPGDDGSGVTSGMTGTPASPHLPIATEVNSHQIEPIMDALAVQNLLARLSPGLTLEKAAPIFNAASSVAGATEESLVDALGLFFQVGQPALQTYEAGWASAGDFVLRSRLHEKISSINSKMDALENAHTGFSLAILLSSSLDLASLASSDDGDGRGYRYALVNGLPFAILMSGYSGTAAAGTLYDASQFSQEYLADRALYLQALVCRNLADQSVVPWGKTCEFRDLASNQAFGSGAYGYLPADAYTHYAFGNNGLPDAVTGGIGADHLYGLAGDDVLNGMAGSDYLDGGAGDDILLGGEGDDILRGSLGADRFVFFTSGSSFGVDTIRCDAADVTNKDRIVIDGVELGGELTPLSPGNVYCRLSGDADGKYRIAITGDVLTIAVAATTDLVDIIRVEGWSSTTHDFGFTLAGNNQSQDTPAAKGQYDVVAFGDQADIQADDGHAMKMNPYAITTQDAGAGNFLVFSGDARAGLLAEGYTGIHYVAEAVRPEYVFGSAVYAYADRKLDSLQASDYEALIRSLSPSGYEADELLDALVAAGDTPAFWNTPLNDLTRYGITWGGEYYFEGSDGADWLGGSLARDVLFGRGGSDYILGDGDSSDGRRDTSQGGNDVLLGGAGSDTILAGGGDDLVWGYGSGSTKAPLTGDSPTDRDTVFAEDGNDLVSGSRASDTISGGIGSDTLFGGGNSDVLLGDEGMDIIMGDSIWASNLDYSLREGVYGVLHPMSFHVQVSGEWNFPCTNLVGHSIYFDDGSEAGLSHDDEIYGGSGNDLLWGEAGADHIDAGPDDDLVFGDRITVAGGYSMLGGVPLGGYAGEIRFHIPYLAKESDAWVETVDGLALSFHGNDLIEGGAGNDVLVGNGGDDHIYGGSGNDTLVGDDVFLDAEAEEILAAHGNDELRGDAGDDILLGGGGNDHLFGDDGADILQGGKGDDEQSGGSGDDILLGLEGSDALYGDDGNDILVSDGDGSGERVDSSNAGDRLDGGAGDDRLYGDAGADILVGGRGSDYLNGGAGNDRYYFYPGDGVDTVDDESGGATLVFSGILRGQVSCTDPGTGRWLIDYSGQTGVDVVSVSSNANYQVQFDDQLVSLAMLKNGRAGQKSASSQGGLLFGSDFSETLIGGNGGDSVFAGSGNDFVAGAGGDDMIFGGDGDDMVYGQEGMDVISGGDGNDFIWVNGADDPDVAANQAYGDKGDDLLYGDSGPDWLDGGLGCDRIHGAAGNDFLAGGDGEDNLYGEEGSDVLVGGPGNDELDGGLGPDRFEFGRGDGQDSLRDTDDQEEPGSNILAFGDGISIDNFFVSNKDQLVNSGSYRIFYTEADSLDVAINAAGSYTIVLSDGSAFSIPALQLPVNLDAGDNIFMGSAMRDAIYGNTGSDTVYGREGADWLFGGAGADLLYGGEGNDLLDGNGGSDCLHGGAGDDYLSAGLDDAGASNYLYGEVGNDFLDQAGYGPARTLMYGGVGDDRYRVVDVAHATVVEYADEGTDTIFYDGPAPVLHERWPYEYSLSIDLPSGIENAEVAFFAGDDDYLQLQGNDLDNQLLGKTATHFHIHGGFGHDVIVGHDAADFLYGDEGDDRIWGGAGDDRIAGGAGNDCLDGGDGEDTFCFSSGFGRDTLVSGPARDGKTVIEFDDTINTGHVRIFRDAGDVRIEVMGTTDSILLQGFSSEAATGWPLLRFGDGSEINLDQPRAFGDCIIAQAAKNQAMLVWDGVGYGYGIDDSVLVRNDWDPLQRPAHVSSLADVAAGGTMGLLDVSPFLGLPQYALNAILYSPGLPGSVEDSFVYQLQTNTGESVWDVEVQARISLQDSPLLRGTDLDDVIFATDNDGLLEDANTAETFLFTTIDGAGGSDLLYDAAGQDAFLFGFGDGRDEIFMINGWGRQAHWGDALHFKAGVDPQDLHFVVNGAALTIGLEKDGRPTGDSVVIPAYYGAWLGAISRFAWVTFEDHPDVNWDMADIEEQRLLDSLTPGDDLVDALEDYGVIDAGAGNDTLNGTWGDDRLGGGTGDDTLIGKFGDDTLWGGDGDDVIDAGWGNDILVGGLGNDFLSGGKGSDVYLVSVGDGRDIIMNDDGDAAEGATDVLEIAGIGSRSELWFSQGGEGGDDLLIDFMGHTADRLVIGDWFSANSDRQQLDLVRVADDQGVWALSNASHAPGGYDADPFDCLLQAMAMVSPPVLDRIPLAVQQLHDTPGIWLAVA